MKTLLLALILIFSVSSLAQTTAIKAEDVQIVFVELQPGFVSQSKTENPKRIADATTTLAKVAKILKIPVTYCVVPFNGKPQGVIPELKPYATDETTFTRGITAPFLEPKIAAALRKNNRKTLVVAGFAAEVAVLQTTLDAVHQGYSVQVPVDAVGSISERTEKAAFRQIEKAGGELTSVLSLVMRLAPDISHPPGTLTFEVLRPILKPSK